MQLKPGDKVLDIGCGVGESLRRIAYLTGAHVTGITISEYQVQRARTIGKNSL
jgi:cyclopropane fatty-acyl-phospholipid synthase-like methyltransferase